MERARIAAVTQAGYLALSSATAFYCAAHDQHRALVAVCAFAGFAGNRFEFPRPTGKMLRHREYLALVITQLALRLFEAHEVVEHGIGDAPKLSRAGGRFGTSDASGTPPRRRVTKTTASCAAHGMRGTFSSILRGYVVCARAHLSTRPTIGRSRLGPMNA